MKKSQAKKVKKVTLRLDLALEEVARKLRPTAKDETDVCNTYGDYCYTQEYTNTPGCPCTQNATGCNGETETCITLCQPELCA
jgi:hypothetical protein